MKEIRPGKINFRHDTSGDFDNTLFTSNYRSMLNVARSAGAHPGEEEDAVQEVWSSVISNPSAQVTSAYLNSSTRNRVIDAWRRRERRPKIVENASFDDFEHRASDNTEGDALNRNNQRLEILGRLSHTERVAAIGTFIQELPTGALKDALVTMNPAHRSVFMLVEVAGLSYEEASNVMKKPLGTIRSSLSRAKEHAKKKIASYGEGGSTD